MTNYRQLAINLAGALWVYGGICPQCGSKKERHMPGCKQTFEDLTNPRDVETVFKKAFEEKSL